MSAASPDWTTPLAERMRPRHIAEFVGQAQLLAPGKPLRQAIETQRLHSMVLWGPPGTGKTTLARLAANQANAEFLALSAVVAGVKDIRAAVLQAQERRAQDQRATVLFLDEVHRFNKAQQDTFLPFLEDGTLIFIGATTENPSFEVNSALLSRARVYVLQSLKSTDLEALLERALHDSARGLGELQLQADAEALALLAHSADGDARRALNLLELSAQLCTATPQPQRLSVAVVQELMGGEQRRFDKYGEQFYQQISALHKSVRGSDPDATLYWLCRMLDGGCDPHYLARRLVRMAVEDIALADPRAFAIAMDAWQAYERLGSPEGELALANAAVYLAVAPKSNAVYAGMKAAQADVKQFGTLDVPLHLRNAPTPLLKNLGFGRNYRYAHDEPEGFVAGEQYLPQELAQQRYYHPVSRGLEIKIAEALARRRTTS